jgi:catechol-2,3-dioxygenase
VLATLDHQSSVSVMLVDPEGNNLEIYWLTGLKADRLQAAPIDLDRPEAELMQRFQA